METLFITIAIIVGVGIAALVIWVVVYDAIYGPNPYSGLTASQCIDRMRKDLGASTVEEMARKYHH